MPVSNAGFGPSCPFSGEKLCVTLTVYKVADMTEAVKMTNAIQVTSNCMSTRACSEVWMYACVCVRVCMYVCMHVYVYVYVCMYLCI